MQVPTERGGTESTWKYVGSCATTFDGKNIRNKPIDHGIAWKIRRRNII